MSGLRFLTPSYFEFFKLAGLMAILLVAVIFLKWFRRPTRSRRSRYRFLGQDWAWFLSLFLAMAVVTAIAGPMVGGGYAISQSGSVDVWVWIDNSVSMATKDLKPSREEIAKNAALNLVNKGILRPGDRLGVFVFGGITRWRLPLSEDFDDFKVKISEIGHPEVYQEETQLDTDFVYLLNYSKNIDKQDSVLKSYQAFFNLKTYRNSRLVFLLSDGNDESESRLDESLRGLVQKNIRVYGIGIGSERGGTTIIRAYDPNDPEKPPEKITVKTKLQTKTLEKISQATGGETFFLTKEEEQNKLESFMREAVRANRSSLPRLVFSNQGREIWWEVLVVPAIFLFLLMLLLAI